MDNESTQKFTYLPSIVSSKTRNTAEKLDRYQQTDYPLAKLTHPDSQSFYNSSYLQSDRNYYHHRRCRHHRHRPKQNLETYDYRWWYMPLNTVHGPRLHRKPKQHYVPRKWYESSSNNTSFFTASQFMEVSPRKYNDCRCEVCRPSNAAPSGFRWATNDYF